MAAVVVVGLGPGPHVEGLLHDVHPQFIAGPQERRGGGIVGAADGVEARLLEQTDPAVFRV